MKVHNNYPQIQVNYIITPLFSFLFRVITLLRDYHSHSGIKKSILLPINSHHIFLILIQVYSKLTPLSPEAYVKVYPILFIENPSCLTLVEANNRILFIIILILIKFSQYILFCYHLAIDRQQQTDFNKFMKYR